MCHSTHVTLFGLTLRPGQSIFNQVVFAVRKAVLGGEYQPGQPFPSVRSLATNLKIHPNTAHKIVQQLIQEGWIEVQPGIGTIVAQLPKARASDRQKLLQQDVERLVVEAKRVGLRMQDLVQAISSEWSKLESARAGNE